MCKCTQISWSCAWPSGAAHRVDVWDYSDGHTEAREEPCDNVTYVPEQRNHCCRTACCQTDMNETEQRGINANTQTCMWRHLNTCLPELAAGRGLNNELRAGLGMDLYEVYFIHPPIIVPAKENKRWNLAVNRWREAESTVDDVRRHDYSIGNVSPRTRQANAMLSEQREWWETHGPAATD